ncbi:MAG: outer membrane lipoprotein chaperone LolA [Gammaproteobacteria bacterium]|nr:outer membrane lipoprotein chaperone LolA [Gammaproteobacteria bacterium]
MKFRKYSVLFFIAFFPGIISVTAHAGEGQKLLNSFYKEVKSIRADFLQILLDDNGEIIQESSGKVVILRPDKFRWDYKEPFPQQIIADGKKFWIYDSELEQVIVRSADQTVTDTPALILSGKKALDENFIIKEEGKHKTLVWVALLPKTSDTDFMKIRMAFDPELAAMELEDHFGQITRILFTNVERNPKVDQKLFEFVVPEGVDVVGG